MTRWMDVLLLPSGLITACIMLTAVFLLLKRKRHAWVFIAVTALLFAIFGSGVTTYWLMGSLEREYLPASQQTGNVPDVIVVLAGYARVSDALPLSGQVNSASVFRCVEAARLARDFPRARLIMSGRGQVPHVMMELLLQLGVAAARIETDAESSDTFESAVHLRERLRERVFFLVTSAGHMPRAMRVFQKQGLQAIPAPTDFRAPEMLLGASLVPSAHHLAVSDLAVHEIIAMAWYRLQGRI